MEPIHIKTEKENIAPIVLLPGDPLRAKYIAENFLSNYQLVNDIRNMFIYTGYYNNKKVTIASSGMGCPSVSIYAYELYQFYNVEKIIRIGTSGTLNKNVKILDVILSNEVYSESSFAYQFNKYREKFVTASNQLNNLIEETAKENNIELKVGPTLTSDVFDVYTPIDHIIDNCPIKDQLLSCEMEGFALFHIANVLNKEAAMLMTVVDSKFEPDNRISSEDRQNSLNTMIKLALESITK